MDATIEKILELLDSNNIRSNPMIGATGNSHKWEFFIPLQLTLQIDPEPQPKDLYTLNMLLVVETLL